MPAALQETTVPFQVGASIRDLFNQPMMASFKLEDVGCILISPRRLGDVISYLHKPPAKPQPPDQLPSGAIFRGMVFGSVGIYTHKTVESDSALVLHKPQSSGQAQPQAAPAAPAPAAPSAQPAAPRPKPVMVGLAGRKEAPAPAPQAAPPPPAALPSLPSVKDEAQHFFAGHQPAPDHAPSEEKLRRWTEIIPSGTKIARPKYPEQPVSAAPAPAAPGPGAAGAPPAPRIHLRRPPVQPAVEPEPRETEAPAALPLDVLPEDIQPVDRVRLAKEADRLLVSIVATIQACPALSAEECSDLALEMRMLQMELDKYRPGIVRVTEMLLKGSELPEIQPAIARLKECLRGLGLLL